MIWKKSNGEDHAEVATSYDNLASVYNRKGEFNKAKEMSEKAVMIRKGFQGEDDAHVAINRS